MTLDEARRENHTKVIEAILRRQAAANVKRDAENQHEHEHEKAIREIAGKLRQRGASAPSISSGPEFEADREDDGSVGEQVP